MRLLLLIAFAGCSSVDEPEFPDPTIEVLEGQNFETTVIGPNYVMHFKGGIDQVHLPDSLVVGGQEMLHTSPNCFQESQAGFAVFPAVLAAANNSGGTPTPGNDDNSPNFVSIDLGGPHLARIVVGFSIDYTCGGSQKVTGKSIYTFFPTGRIVRQDLGIQASTTLMNSSLGCACETPDPGGGGFVFTSYWAFNQSDANVGADNVAVTTNANGACSIYPDRAIAVQFDRPTSRVGVNNIASHVFDFATGAPLNVSTQNLFSAIQLDETSGPDCGQILKRLSDPQIVFTDDINGNRSFSTNQDGIYGDEVGIRLEPFEIRPGIDGDLPPGFTVSFDLDGGTADITREDGSRPDMLIQRDFPGSTRFFVVFIDGLEVGQTITVEPK